MTDKAIQLGIDLIYLPPYSPDLNLIERLWKFVKKKGLYSVYYDHFAHFKNAISHDLLQTHSTYQEELDSLFALHIQTFENSRIVTM